MSKRFLTAAFFGLLVWSLHSAAHEDMPSTISIATDDYLPYTSRANNGSGALGEIVRESFALEGIQVEYVFASWKRCELLAAAGEVFGALPYFVNEERLQSFDFSAPIAYGITRFYYNKLQFPEGFTWERFEDFKGYRMGGIQGYWYIPEFNQAGLDIHLVQSEEQNFAKLAKQRIDFTLAGQPRAEEALRKLSTDDQNNIDSLTPPESFEGFHIMVSRTYPHAQIYSKLFKSGLKKLIASGRYQQLLDRYRLSTDYAVDEAAIDAFGAALTLSETSSQ